MSTLYAGSITDFKTLETLMNDAVENKSVLIHEACEGEAEKYYYPH